MATIGPGLSRGPVPRCEAVHQDALRANQHRSCADGWRATVFGGCVFRLATVVGLVAQGMRECQIVEQYPDLEVQDVQPSSCVCGSCGRRASTTAADRYLRLLVDTCAVAASGRGPPRGSHDALHVRDLGLQSADDTVLFELAVREGRRLAIRGHRSFGTPTRPPEAVRGPR